MFWIWVQIIISTLFLLIALQQFRMTLIYLSVIHSPVIDEAGGPRPVLTYMALSSALKFLAFAVILFLANWPALITYMLAALLLKSIVDFCLAVFAIGPYGVLSKDLSKKFNPPAYKLIPVGFYAVTLASSFYFLGY